MNPKRFFIIMLAVLSLATATSIMGFLWADKQLKKSAASVSELLATRDVQTEKIESLKASKKSVQDPKTLEALINTLLPKQKKQDNLIANVINTATKQAGISTDQITNITFSGSNTPDSLSGTTLSKEVTGVYVYPFTLQLKNISYETMLKLFSEFEKSKRIIQADQVQIVPDKAKVGYLTSITLSLKTFVQP